MLRVFVINLLKSKNRRLHMESNLQLNDIPFEFFQATDGNCVSEPIMDKIYAIGKSFRYKYGRNMEKGEIGCALSHIKLYKKIISENIDYALILEDDIEFDGRLKHLISDEMKLKKIFQKYELILIGYAENDLDYRKGAKCSYWERLNIDRFIKIGIPINRCWGTIGYLISYTGAKKLLEAGELPSMQADWLTSNSPSVNVKFGVMRNQLVWPGELDDESMIGLRTFHNENVFADVGENNFERKSILFSRLKKNTIIKTLYYYYLIKSKSIRFQIELIRKKMSLKHYNYIKETKKIWLN